MRRHQLSSIGTLILSAALLAGCQQGEMSQRSMSEPAKVAQTAAGSMLTDSRGMTLYTFDRDTSDKAACNGACAQNWPPLMASSDAKAMDKWSVVTRDDGAKQWAYAGKPLYSWSKDQKPGDTTGDGFLNNSWHVARP
jgi:predicted lipoprotein with Yx(FWY)xxD motif